MFTAWFSVFSSQLLQSAVMGLNLAVFAKLNKEFINSYDEKNTPVLPAANKVFFLFF